MLTALLTEAALHESRLELRHCRGLDIEVYGGGTIAGIWMEHDDEQGESVGLYTVDEDPDVPAVWTRTEQKVYSRWEDRAYSRRYGEYGHG